MILVTGAAGKTGQAIIQALVQRGAAVRALIYHPKHTDLMHQLGVKELVIGDMRQETTLQQAMYQAKAVYHICSNMNPAEVAIGQHAIHAAHWAKVAHFVYHSVLHPQCEAMPHHWHKLRVEEKLFASGLAVTILQPAAYMQNLLAYRAAITTEGIYRFPYSPSTCISLVDLANVAEVAAKVLTEGGHAGAIYELVGLESPTQTEVAATLSECLGRHVQAEQLPLAEWLTQARANGLGDYQIETLAKMFRYYDQHYFVGNGRVLQWLLQRSATTLEQFVRREWA